MSSSKETILLDELRQAVADIDDKVAKSDIQFLFNELWLLIMLRCNDFNASAALKSLNIAQHAIRHKHSDWFRKFRPEAFENIILESDAIGVLKDTDTYGNCVVIIRTQSWNVKVSSLEDMIISAMIIGLELLEKEVDMQINGAVIVIDVRGISFAQVRQVSPLKLRKIIDLIFHSTPLKFNGIHVVNLNYMVNAILNIGKPLLPRKTAALLFTHNSPKSLHSYISKKSLPTWLGGECSDDQVSNSSVKYSCFKPDRIKWYRKFVEIASDEM